jgi:hypothetical protein
VNALVLIALRRPYTFVVLALVILLFGALSVLRTPTDIFLPVKIPVIAAIWTYNGGSVQKLGGHAASASCEASARIGSTMLPTSGSNARL